MTLDPSLDTHTAIVGASGAGKTVTAKGQVEQLLADRRHVVIIDPTGAWWGMRSNADGDGPGFDIPIFGGLHGDVPIDAGDGRAIAGLVIDQPVSAIIDLSELHDEEELREFMLAFVERLREKPQANLHLVVDEADEFCPQIAADSVSYRLIRQMTWIAKRGRLRGFVLTVITQRPADVSNSVLSQMQTIIAHQLILPHDQDAIDRYLKRHGTKEVRTEVMTSLSSLRRGERWIYSPGASRLERGMSPALTTFDSSSTPVAGLERAQPRLLGQIDVAAIKAALAKPESQKAGNPESPIATEELAARDHRIAELEAELEVASRRAGRAQEAVDALLDGMSAATDALDRARERIVDEADIDPSDANLHAPDADLHSSGAVSLPVAAAKPRVQKARQAAPAPTPAGGTSDRPLGPSARDMLAILKGVAPEGATWADLALATGRMAHGGSMNGARASLRTGGWIQEAEDGTVTASTRTLDDRAVPIGAWPAPADLRVRWSAALGPTAAAVIAYLADIEVGAATPAAIGAGIGRAAHGGSWNTAVKALRVSGVAPKVDAELVLHRFLMENDDG